MDAPFDRGEVDRGEVDRASLDATERLRARLSGQPRAAAQPRRSSVLPWVIAGSMFIFTAGMIANPWFESSVRGRLPFAQKPVATAPAGNVAVEDRLAKLETTADAAAPMPVERLARTEAKIETSSDQIAREADRVDRLTSEVAALGATMRADHAKAESALFTATAAADRAQAMLVLVLARRAVDSGRAFGALDPLLRQSFEARYPAAVKSLSALGTDPVTIASLRRDFDAMRPALGVQTDAQDKLSWWDALSTKVSSVIGRPATTALTHEAAAQVALQRGDAVAAANHLRRLPTPRPPELANWLAAATRLQLGTQALAMLENATLLPPDPPVPPPTVTAAAPPADTPTVAAPPAAAPAPAKPAQKSLSLSFGPSADAGNLLARVFAYRLRLTFD